jgi:Tetratricopeptide repeat.
MPSRSPSDCHRCGTRLARDNHTGLCGGCRRATAKGLLSPPSVPANFWRTKELLDAFAERHIGHVIRAYRHHPYHGPRPLPQDVVAGWMGQSQAQLSRLENGPGLRDLDRLVAWATLLGMPAELLWFALPGASAPRAAHEADSFGLSFIRALRAADRQVGGAHLYATVTTHLNRHWHPRLGRSEGGTKDETSLAGVALLSEMAGWMALDSGSKEAAQRHLTRAARLAAASGDTQLTAQSYASLSHVARLRGNGAEALAHAETGLRHLRSGPPHGPLAARLLIMRACGLAASGDPAGAVAVTAEAEREFTNGGGDGSPWLSPFDAASFASEAAWCFLRIGDHPTAVTWLDQALVYRDASRVRSRALAQLMLAVALLGQGRVDQGRVDQACALVDEALEATTNLGSALLLERLHHVNVLLGPHLHRVTGVSDTAARLSEAIRDRTWIATAAVVHEVSATS